MRKITPALILLLLPFMAINVSCDVVTDTTLMSSSYTNGIRMRVIADNLQYPWGIAFLPDKSALITERIGQLRLIKDGKLSEPVNGIPKDIFIDTQAGLLDVAIDPDYNENHIIYLSYIKGDNNLNATTLIKANFDGKSLSNVKEIFSAQPMQNNVSHFGGRILFLPDKTILFSVGDGSKDINIAQDLQSDLGKIIHIDRNGNAVSKSKIFTYGHHNPQGLTYDPQYNRIYEHEHGPKGGDELNILKEGGNYGWPIVTYGVDNIENPISHQTERKGTIQPLIHWDNIMAPSGMVVYHGKKFKLWDGDILIATLAGQQIRRIDMENGKIVGQEAIFVDMETRFRNIIQAPDDSIWLLTDDSAGKILRITPN